MFTDIEITIEKKVENLKDGYYTIDKKTDEFVSVDNNINFIYPDMMKDLKNLKDTFITAKPEDVKNASLFASNDDTRTQMNYVNMWYGNDNFCGTNGTAMYVKNPPHIRTTCMDKYFTVHKKLAKHGFIPSQYNDDYIVGCLDDVKIYQKRKDNIHIDYYNITQCIDNNHYVGFVTLTKKELDEKPTHIKKGVKYAEIVMNAVETNFSLVPHNNNTFGVMGAYINGLSKYQSYNINNLKKFFKVFKTNTIKIYKLDNNVAIVMCG